MKDLKLMHILSLSTFLGLSSSGLRLEPIPDEIEYRDLSSMRGHHQPLLIYWNPETLGVPLLSYYHLR
jgi:hypothetical protein